MGNGAAANRPNADNRSSVSAICRLRTSSEVNKGTSKFYSRQRVNEPAINGVASSRSQPAAAFEEPSQPPAIRRQQGLAGLHLGHHLATDLVDEIFRLVENSGG